MRILTPSRIVAAVAVAVAALSFGVAHANTDHNGASAHIGSKACVHGTAQLERNKRNVVGYYTRAFNDKDPEGAVARYVGFDKPGQDLDHSGEPHLYIQHNPLAASGARRSSASCGTSRQRFQTCTSTSVASSPNATS